MEKLRTEKVVGSLPPLLTPNTIYYVRVGSGFDLYVTNSTGIIAGYSLNRNSLKSINVNSGTTGIVRFSYNVVDTEVTSNSIISIFFPYQPNRDNDLSFDDFKFITEPYNGGFNLVIENLGQKFSGMFNLKYNIS